MKKRAIILIIAYILLLVVVGNYVVSKVEEIKNSRYSLINQLMTE